MFSIVLHQLCRAELPQSYLSSLFPLSEKLSTQAGENSKKDPCPSS